MNSAASTGKYKELAREIDVYHEADVVVVGGGAGGEARRQPEEAGL